MELERLESELGVLKLMIKGYEETGGGYSQIEALKYVCSFLKSMKDASIVPEEKVITLIDLQCSSAACGACMNKCNAEYIEVSQVLLGLASFKQRLPEIIKEYVPYKSFYVVPDLTKAILSEIEGE